MPAVFQAAVNGERHRGATDYAGVDFRSRNGETLKLLANFSTVERAVSATQRVTQSRSRVRMFI